MQAVKKAVETLKETAANIGASAKSGLEKTKATVQEKTEKMSAHDQSQKDMATQKKEEKISQAEMEKQQAREYNAAAKQSAVAGHMTQGHYTATGPETEPATIDTTGPWTETATNNTTGPGFENVVHSNTGPATATYNTSGAGHESVLLSSTGPANATYNTNGPGHDNVLPSSTGPWPETATYPTGDYGQIGANQTALMPGHGPGPRHGGLTDDVVGSRPIETNSGVGTTAQTTLGAGSAPPSGPNFN